MPDLTIQVQEPSGVSGAALVTLNGSIDAKTVITFQTHLNTVKVRGIKRFILDMENVRYVNSTGLGYLINLSDSVSSEQGVIALVKIQPKVKVVFDMLGLNAFFKIYGTTDDAMRFLQGGAADTSGTAVNKAVSEKAPVPAAPAPAPAPAPTAQNRVECRTCRTVLTLRDAGAYKCPRCFTLFHYAGNGKTSFLPRRNSVPAQLSLNFSDECTTGLLEFVRLLSRRSGFQDEQVRQIQNAVRDTVGTIQKHAYAGNVGNIYHVLVLSNESEIELRFADYGTSFDPKEAPTRLFSSAQSLMDRLEVKNNPKGGNVVTFSKKSK